MAATSTKNDKSKFIIKDNDLFKMKEVSSETKNNPECYVKVIKKDYFNNQKMKLKLSFAIYFKTGLQKNEKN